MEYNSEPAQLTSLFTEFRNSINIYTEDEEKDKKFYRTLFSRLLDGTGIVINDIIPLGDCKSVMDACRTDSSNSPKLYIVDGDIDLMVSPKNPLSNLFILDRYCIENYMIDENAFYCVYNELDDIHEIEQLKSLVNFNVMMSDAHKPLLDLFRHFATSQKVQGVFILKDVSQVMNDKGNIDIDKVTREKTFVKNDVMTNKSLTLQEFEELINNFETVYPDNIENLITYVSGKDYLLPYIESYTKKRLGLNLGLKKGNWKYQFSKYCNLDPLDSLKQAIILATTSTNDVIKSTT